MQGKNRHNRLNLADAHPVPPTRPLAAACPAAPTSSTAPTGPPHRTGVWLANSASAATDSTPAQLEALAGVGIDWARP
ncbi:hypothetical protein SSAG_00215 [Streptomyces sp. Mg1]|nr:hypothetical protein SSAG_00215 [Streptomyces sp. Mg1]